MTKAKPAVQIRHSPMEHPGQQYPAETAALKEIALGCGLVEKIKWGKPCFMLGGANIVLIQRFNDYVALMFFKGALLEDSGKRLSRVGAHMQAPRQLRFRSVAEVIEARDAVEAFIKAAIELEKSGAKVVPRDVAEVCVPVELQARLDAEPALRRAFAELTPGRQKGYLYQIAAAKQAATRTARVAKFVPMILAGKGLND